jgi:hypothetical protein
MIKTLKTYYLCAINTTCCQPQFKWVAKINAFHLVNRISQ